MDSNLFYLTRSIEQITDSERKHILRWRIPDFMWLLNNQTNREIRTEKSETIENKNIQYEFQVRIKFVGLENDLIEIYYKNTGSTFVEPSLGIWMEGGYKSMTNNISKSQQPYQLPNYKWQFLAVQFKRKLTEERKLTDNEMDLKFEFLVNDRSNNLTKELPYLLVNEKEELTEPNCDLINDLSNLLMTTSFSDIKVKSLEGDEFPAHKIFLATRSAVFKAHFEHNTLENVTNVVESPFEADVLKDVLSYIYTDEALKLDELSQKLLVAADFYQLNGLKKLCETALERKLTVENAIETLELANLYKAVYLKRKTLEFIKDGLAGDVTKSKGWQTAEALLVKSVYEYVINDLIA